MEMKRTRGIRRICVHFAGRPREWRAISISRGKEVIRAQAAVSERPQFNFYFKRDAYYIYGSTDTQTKCTTRSMSRILARFVFHSKDTGRDDGYLQSHRYFDRYFHAICNVWCWKYLLHSDIGWKDRAKSLVDWLDIDEWKKKKKKGTRGRKKTLAERKGGVNSAKVGVNGPRPGPRRPRENIVIARCAPGNETFTHSLS